MTDTSHWTIDNSRAMLAHPRLSGQLDLRNPQHGLTQIQVESTAFAEAAILQLHLHSPTPTTGETVIDAYARSTDVIATYAQTPARTIRPQCNWRLLVADQAVGVQLNIGIQTSLLESDPLVQSITEVCGSQFLRYVDGDWQTGGEDLTTEGGTGLFLVRPSDSPWSYAEMIFPHDYEGSRITLSQNRVRLQHPLFSQLFLEKGVIRTAQIQGWVLPRELDTQLAEQFFQAFAAQPFPLTT